MNGNFLAALLACIAAVIFLFGVPGFIIAAIAIDMPEKPERTARETLRSLRPIDLPAEMGDDNPRTYCPPFAPFPADFAPVHFIQESY